MTSSCIESFVSLATYVPNVHTKAIAWLTRNSSEDDIANFNFLYDDILHVLQNTIDSCINSATDRRGYVLERMRLPNSVK